MNCCENCFKDVDTRGFIKSNSTQKGDCDYCGTTSTEIMPAVELYDNFQELYSAYIIPTNTSLIPVEELMLLHQHFINWQIFSDLEPDIIKRLVLDIGTPIATDNPELFQNQVSPVILCEQNYIDQEKKFINIWEDFKKEIVTTNRFIVKATLDFEILEKIFTSFQKKYRARKQFYRARVSNKEGLPDNQMGKPPAKIASPGRANPKGIPYLYLSNDVKTTMYEVRASLYDYVTVAEFRLSEEIKVTSLRNMNQVSPFQITDINVYLQYKRFINLLEADLMKPLRKQDTDLDYIPTQYLCEFIKSLGFDGVEYGSSLNPEGFNIALFNDSKVECFNTTVYDITNISYDYEEL